MGSSEYRFLTHWRVEGTCAAVSAVLGDASAFPRWWGDVYLDVRPSDQPAPPGAAGPRMRVLTKGILPYRLRWEFVALEPPGPSGFTLQAFGDFEGVGTWTFRQDGAFVDMTFDWRIRAEKPLIKRLSFLFRPIFEANHRWAMARGEEGLRRQLAAGR